MGAPYEGGFIHTPSDQKQTAAPLGRLSVLVREAGLEVHVPRLAASILSFYG